MKSLLDADPRQHVRHGPEKPGGQHLRHQDPRGGQGHRGGEGRLPAVQVVRLPGVRAGHEGAGRRHLPLHAPGAERHRGRLPRVREEVHHRHLLGRGLLSHRPESGRQTRNRRAGRRAGPPSVAGTGRVFPPGGGGGTARNSRRTGGPDGSENFSENPKKSGIFS